MHRRICLHSGPDAPAETEVVGSAAGPGAEAVPFPDDSDVQFGSNDVIIEPSPTPESDSSKIDAFGAGETPGLGVSFDGNGFAWPTADTDARASSDDSGAEADPNAEADISADDAGIGAPEVYEPSDADDPPVTPSLDGFNFTSSNSTSEQLGVVTSVPLPSPISVEFPDDAEEPEEERTITGPLPEDDLLISRTKTWVLRLHPPKFLKGSFLQVYYLPIWHQVLPVWLALAVCLAMNPAHRMLVKMAVTLAHKMLVRTRAQLVKTTTAIMEVTEKTMTANQEMEKTTAKDQLNLKKRVQDGV
jgi:hypothetical protein